MTRTNVEMQFLQDLNLIANDSHTSNLGRAENFPAWVPRQNLARFLASAEIYPQIVGLHGIVVEGGVAGGAGLFTWAHLASILEPYNYSRVVVGFDYAEDEETWSELRDLARLHDMNRPLGHIPRVEFVGGDAVETIPEYRRAHPGLAVAMLVLDFTTYEATRVALETFWPVMAPGAVVVSGGIHPDELKAVEPYGVAFRRCPWSTTLIWGLKP